MKKSQKNTNKNKIQINYSLYKQDDNNRQDDMHRTTNKKLTNPRCKVKTY